MNDAKQQNCGNTDGKIRQVEQIVSSADRWFERNLKCLLGGQITLIEQGKQKNINRKELADWILSHC